MQGKSERSLGTPPHHVGYFAQSVRSLITRRSAAAARLQPRTIAAKLVLLAILLLLAVVCITLVALHHSRSTRLGAEQVYKEGVLGLLLATRLEVALERHRRIVESAPAEFDRSVIASERREILEIDGQLLNDIGSMRAVAQSNAADPGITQDDIRNLIQAGQQTLFYAENFALDKAQDAAADYTRIAASLDERLRAYRRQRVEIAERVLDHLVDIAQRLTVWIGISVLSLLLLLGPIGQFLLSNVFERLSAMRHVVQDLAHSQVDVTIPFMDHQDEVGELARALGQFRATAIALIETEKCVAAQNAELSQLSASLERRVQERTREAELAVEAAEKANDLLLQEIEQTTIAQAELRATNVKLVAATHAKMQFLANMSHEIRTPMNGVLGMGDLLLRTTLDDRQRHLLETLLGSAKMLLVVIDDILDLSRIESGKVVIDSKPFEVDRFFDEVTGTVCLSAHAKSLDFDVIIAPDVPMVLRGDVVRLRQVLLNLVGNAIKFTANGEVIVRVGTQRSPDGDPMLLVQVSDTGIGIAMAEQMRLFQPFSQADETISRQYGGTGLGLAISKNLVELMGGTVAVESEPARGSCFSFTIPLEACATEAGKTADVPLPVGAVVAVVAGRHVKRQALASLVTRAGAQALAFGSAGELERWAAGADAAGQLPTAIVLDAAPSEDLAATAIAGLIRQLPDAKLFVIAPTGSQLHPRLEIQDMAANVISRTVLRSTLASALRPLGAIGRAAMAAQSVALRQQRLDLPPGFKVLVAEDNPVNQEILREDLEALGCDDIVLACNGFEALEAFEAAPFDLVLMDCQMPGMDGLRATRRIRAVEARRSQPPTSIIAVTAGAFQSDRDECLASGMTAFLSKPFRLADLANVLAAELEKNAPITAGARRAVG